MIIRHRGVTYGFKFMGRDAIMPSAESWGRGQYRTVSAIGFTAWIDRLPPTTVGERGVW